MNFDIPHMLATMVVIAIALFIGNKLGWREHRRFDWRTAALIFAGVLLLNLLWRPYGS